jgi:hypothetical protein
MLAIANVFRICFFMKKTFFIRDQLENQVIQELKACLAFKDSLELQDLQVHLAHLAKL